MPREAPAHDEIDLDAVAALLERSPDLRAREIAAALDLDRRSLNQVLHSRIDRFVKDAEDHTWKARTEATIDHLERPPGPFGPAAALLPANQQLAVVDQTTACRDVQRLILDNDFSAIPVTENDGVVTGIATLESIAEHLHRVDSTNTSLGEALESPIRHACERARYVGPATYIDRHVDWLDVQHVIVGTAREPLGILTIADVWAILHRFTEAFVLIHEIEVELRRLITRHAGDRGTPLADLFAAMHVQDGMTRPSALEQLSFSQYLHVMYSPLGTPIFEPVMGSRSIFRASFDAVNRIRNDVMHFRDHAVPESSIKSLRAFRMTVRG
ncbi:CBS domain-containing protein [bacterium]|nr:CBS domain-containing protein [bacterium]